MGRLDLDPALLEAVLIRCREEALSDPSIGEGVAWSSIVVSMIDEVLPRDPGDERRPYPWSREEALRDLGESTGDAITIELDQETAATLEKLATREDVSRETMVARALRTVGVLWSATVAAPPRRSETPAAGAILPADYARLAQHWSDGGWGADDARRHLMQRTANPELLALAKSAVEAQERRKGEDVDAWAEQLAADSVAAGEMGFEARILAEPVRGSEKDECSTCGTSFEGAWPWWTPHVDHCVKHGTHPDPDEPCWSCDREAQEAKACAHPLIDWRCGKCSETAEPTRLERELYPGEMQDMRCALIHFMGIQASHDKGMFLATEWQRKSEAAEDALHAPSDEKGETSR